MHSRYSTFSQFSVGENIWQQNGIACLKMGKHRVTVCDNFLIRKCYTILYVKYPEP